MTPSKLRFSTFIKILASGVLSIGLLSAQNQITCSSNNGGRNVCPANTRRGVRLVNQRSGSPCIQGRTWGYDRRGIWVDRGCRADFALGNYGGGGRPGIRPPGGGRPIVQTINCSSNNGKRNWCRNDSNGAVRLVRQISGSPCRKGYSWGTQPGSVWVDRGCRADFEIVTNR